MKHKQKPENRFIAKGAPEIPTGVYKLDLLTWQEVEYLGKLSRENKIKVIGTGRRSLRIKPITDNS